MNAGVCGGTAKNHPESPVKNHVTYPRKAVPVITGYGLSTSLILSAGLAIIILGIGFCGRSVSLRAMTACYT